MNMDLRVLLWLNMIIAVIALGVGFWSWWVPLMAIGGFIGLAALAGDIAIVRRNRRTSPFGPVRKWGHHKPVPWVIPDYSALMEQHRADVAELAADTYMPPQIVSPDSLWSAEQRAQLHELEVRHYGCPPHRYITGVEPRWRRWLRRLTPAWLITAMPLLLIPAALMSAGRAHADPVDTYVATNGTAICELIDDHPTHDGVIAIGVAIMKKTGWDSEDAATIVVESIYLYCPEHKALLKTGGSTGRAI